MKKWTKPEVQKLDVAATYQGNDITTHVDDSTVWNNHTYYSFS